MVTKNINIEKKIKIKKVFKTLKVGTGKFAGHWYEGKFYVPLISITKKGRNKIISGIQLGNSKRFLYTLDKKRVVKGFAPNNLL